MASGKPSYFHFYRQEPHQQVTLPCAWHNQIFEREIRESTQDVKYLREKLGAKKNTLG